MSNVKSYIKFKEWMKKFIDISEFADLVVTDETFPDTSEWEVIEDYLIAKQANEELYFRFYKAFLLYKASFDSYQQELIIKRYFKENMQAL